MTYMEEIKAEVDEYYEGIDLNDDGKHVWDNLAKLTAIVLRLHAIRAEIVWMEIEGTCSPEIKKFRTMYIDDAIEAFDMAVKMASRKMAGQDLEWQMSQRGV